MLAFWLTSSYASTINHWRKKLPYKQRVDTSWKTNDKMPKTKRTARLAGAGNKGLVAAEKNFGSSEMHRKCIWYPTKITERESNTLFTMCVANT